MSNSLSVVEQIEYDSLVKIEYRSAGFLLRDTMRMRHDVTGSQVDFRKVGEVLSLPTAYQQSVTAQDPGYTKATATLVKHTTPIAIDTVQDLTVNFDSKMESVMLIGAAMGRRSDQIGIDTLAANAGSTIVNGGTNFSYAKFTQMLEQFEDNGVPPAERFVAMSASNFRSLLANQEFTNIDFTANRVIDNAEVRRYLGFNLVTIPAMTEGGLPKTGNIRDAFAWHKMAVGAGISCNFRTEVNYIPEKTSWLANGIFSMGAVVIDNRGVQKIQCDETA